MRKTTPTFFDAVLTTCLCLFAGQSTAIETAAESTVERAFSGLTYEWRELAKMEQHTNADNRGCVDERAAMARELYDQARSARSAYLKLKSQSHHQTLEVSSYFIRAAHVTRALHTAAQRCVAILNGPSKERIVLTNQARHAWSSPFEHIVGADHEEIEPSTIGVLNGSLASNNRGPGRSAK